MPRNGSGVMSKPAGTTAQPNTTIESAKYNATIDDIIQDLNNARPVVAGGTGGATAVAGGDNLSTKGADIASAATTDIGASTGRYVHITGTTTITSLGTKTAGVLRVLTFDGALTLTHNATSLILPGGANILTAANDMAVFVSEGGGNWRCASFTRASGVPLRAEQGHLYGLTLSNDAGDTTNDIGITIGSAASENDTSPILMSLTSALVKRLDANWAAGTNNGMRYSGAAIANTTYHIYLASTAAGGSVDIYADPSADLTTVLGHLQAETGGSAYTKLRRIGSILRVGAAIILFTQTGDEFLRSVPVLDVTTTTLSTTAVVSALSVPLGIQVGALINFRTNHASSAIDVLVTSVSQADTAPTATLFTTRSAAGENANSGGTWTTNVSGQIRYRSDQSNTSLNLFTRGWIDTRGRV